MKKWIIIVAGLVAASAAVGIALWLFVYPRFAVRLVYVVRPQAKIDVTIPVLRQRLQVLKRRFGLYQRGQEIHLELPEMTSEELKSIDRMLTAESHLELSMVDDRSDLPARVARAAVEAGGFSIRTDSYSSGAEVVEYTTFTSSDKERLKGYLERLPAELKPPPGRRFLVGEWVSSSGEKKHEVYFLETEAILTGDHVADAEVLWDERTGRPEVNLVFSAEGAETFARVTRENIGRRLAIVLNGDVTSAPVIMSEISGGRARITLGGLKGPLQLQMEAQELAAQLKARNLPAKVILARTEQL